MTFSIIIPVWNGLEFLKSNLPFVVGTHADEVIIVDDASPDASYDFVRQTYPRIKCLRHPKNLRFPQSINDGVAAATGDIVILLNQDVKPDKHLLKHLDHYFHDPQIFAVSFNEQENSWADATLVNGFIEFHNGIKDHLPHPSFWANGGSSAYRRKLWNELGGFDTIFTPGYFEDFDICWRARNRGLSIYWDPDAKVFHDTGSTHNRVFDPVYLRRIKERNYLLAHWKNLSTKDLQLHIRGLLLRVIRHPGYLIPILMGLKFIPEISKFRKASHG